MMRQFEPGIGLASLDMALQEGADRLGLRKRYFDLREGARARLETIDLGPNRAANFIFVHIPKCGGTTIEKQTGIVASHRSAAYFRQADPAFFEKAFKFSITRNPYDRLVSGYHYLRNHTTSPLNQAWVDRNLARFRNFAEFAEELQNPRFARSLTSWKHFVPQWFYLCRPDGTFMVDFVGKLEAYPQAIAEIARRSPLRLENEIYRASRRQSWGEYYTPASRRAVAEIYGEDFRIFEYPV
jgi:hypothetical protein